MGTATEQLRGVLRHWVRRLSRAAMFCGAGVMAIGFSSAPAYASSQSGTITYVAFTSGRILFGMSGTRSARPGCDCCNRWEISAGDAPGQALMSIIMTAYASGKSVSLSGSGSCVGSANDTEGVGYLQSN